MQYLLRHLVQTEQCPGHSPWSAAQHQQLCPVLSLQYLKRLIKQVTAQTMQCISSAISCTLQTQASHKLYIKYSIDLLHIGHGACLFNLGACLLLSEYSQTCESFLGLLSIASCGVLGRPCSSCNTVLGLLCIASCLGLGRLCSRLAAHLGLLGVVSCCVLSRLCTICNNILAAREMWLPYQTSR